MPTLNVVDFNIVCAVLGGFITAFGLVSYLLKEKFFLSETLISTFVGIAVSPHGANFIKPLQYANGSQEALDTITLYFSRLVLGVQLVLAGVQLPSKYLRTEWKSLSLLLGPGMCAMWLSTSLLVWALVPNIDYLFALAIAACVTPTDPVLSNNIVKGKFADKNIPPSLQKIIIAESGANDGLGYPFLFLALYLIKYTGFGGLGASGGAGEAIGLWFSNTWAYTIILSVVYGAVVGWLAKELLHWAEERRYVDRESFLVFAITLALFIVGTVGLIGSDDVLACFIAGNTFTWDDWFRLETEDDSLQPTIDMLLNVAVFLWYGAICPWHMFVANNVVPIYRLIVLGILVLLLRRLPMVLLYHKLNLIHQIEDIRHAFFVGFFGPIGVSAVFYLYITREFLRTVTRTEGFTATITSQERPDAQHLDECVEVVVWFLVVCSIIGHGLSIPLGKLGFYIPRTLSNAVSFERSDSRPGVPGEQDDTESPMRQSDRRDIDAERDHHGQSDYRHTTSRGFGSLGAVPSPSIWSKALTRLWWNTKKNRIQPHAENGGSVDDRNQNITYRPQQASISISAPFDGRKVGHAIDDDNERSKTSTPSRTLPRVSSRSRSQSKVRHETKQRSATPQQSSVASVSRQPLNRSILFADEPRPATQSDIEMASMPPRSASAQHKGSDPASETAI